MESSLKLVTSEIPRLVATPTPAVPRDTCRSGPQCLSGEWLGVLTCPVVPQACDVALWFCYLLELTARGSAEIWHLHQLLSGEVTGLSHGCMLVSLLQYNGTVKSWCSWPRFGSGEIRDETTLDFTPSPQKTMKVQTHLCLQRAWFC